MQDGKAKNECEKNALRRYLEHLKSQHIDNKKGIKHKFRFANNVTLNLQDQAEQVNVLDYIEIDKEGKQHFWQQFPTNTKPPLLQAIQLYNKKSNRTAYLLKKEDTTLLSLT